MTVSQMCSSLSQELGTEVSNAMVKKYNKVGQNPENYTNGARMGGNYASLKNKYTHLF